MFDYTYLWLALAFALAVLEANTATLVCLWFVVGSVFAFISGLFVKNFFLQLAVFIITSAIRLAVTKPLADKIFIRRPVPTNFDMLIGKTRTVIRDISPDRKGRVKVEGLTWLAGSRQFIPKGEKVEILGISGATLTVRPVRD